MHCRHESGQPEALPRARPYAQKSEKPMTGRAAAVEACRLPSLGFRRQENLEKNLLRPRGRELCVGLRCVSQTIAR
jgi:hypothetical protein